MFIDGRSLLAMTSMARRSRWGRITNKQSGLTLIELVIFIVVVSVGVVGILSVMNITAQHSADPMVRKQAVAMAEAILDEVLAKEFDNPSGGFAETDFNNCSGRAQYDDVGDYSCFDGAPTTAVIKGDATLGSSSIAALSSYEATIGVADVTISGVVMKKVTVTVTGGGDSIVLYGYRASY